jgi:hypothetical protein
VVADALSRPPEQVQESPPTSPSWDSRGDKAKMKMSTSSGGLNSGPVGGESEAAIVAVAAGSTAAVDFLEMAACQRSCPETATAKDSSLKLQLLHVGDSRLLLWCRHQSSRWRCHVGGSLTSMWIWWDPSLSPRIGTATCSPWWTDQPGGWRPFLYAPHQRRPAWRPSSGGWVACIGMPGDITSDRGVQFSSGLWAVLCQKLGISHHSTTAYHPQSNGRVERFNRQLKDALRARLRDRTGRPSCPGS